MNNTFVWLLDLLKKQGLSFVLLGFAVWYFYGEVQRLNQKVEMYQSRIIELYQGVILENTDALKRVNIELDEINHARLERSRSTRDK